MSKLSRRVLLNLLQEGVVEDSVLAKLLFEIFFERGALLRGSLL